MASLVLVLVLAACPRAPARDVGASDAGASLASSSDYDPAEPLLVELEKDEAAWRASTDWATFPSSDETLGPDPYDIVALPNGMYAGALRGANAVVLLSRDLQELDRAPAPKGARSLHFAPRDPARGEPGMAIDVVGDLDPRVYRVVALGAGQGSASGPAIFTSGGVTHFVPNASGLRGVTRAPDGALLVVDVEGDLHRLARGKSERGFVEEHIGAFTLAPRTGGSLAPPQEALEPEPRGSSPGANPKGGPTWLATASVQSHSVEVARLDAHASRHGAKAFTVDGPVLGVAVRPLSNGDALVAFGYIEDHPLDRTIGSFGFIDSFVRVVRVFAKPEHGVRTVVDVNVSEHGVLTPKALGFASDDALIVAGAGSAKGARISWRGDTSSPGEPLAPTVAPFSSLPGVVALVATAEGFVGASPLLDAWVIVDVGGARAVPVPVVAPEGARSPKLYVEHERSVDSKLGEALMFTNIIAPRQKSDGALSRFTCEACHFEGIVDGRTHDTGRMGAMSAREAPDAGGAAEEVEDHVRATTKPLWGLFNNVPLFTRAMDPNVARMVHAEFNVANSNSSLDPWFALTPADAPWLSLLGVTGTRTPIELRKAMTTFFRDFTPRTNPHVAARLAGVTGTATFTPEERKGAEVFRARCASCHAARLVGDDPKSEQPFERWEALVLSANGPIVWSSPEHRKTGVEPYVHEDGARASSLRRVWLKTPLFTTGAAKTLGEVLDMVRLHDQTILHQSKRVPGVPLADDEKRALLAFLRLL